MVCIGTVRIQAHDFPDCVFFGVLIEILIKILPHDYYFLIVILYLYLWLLLEHQTQVAVRIVLQTL